VRFIALTAKQRAKGFFNESRKTGKLTALRKHSKQIKITASTCKNRAENKRLLSQVLTHILIQNAALISILLAPNAFRAGKRLACFTK